MNIKYLAASVLAIAACSMAAHAGQSSLRPVLGVIVTGGGDSINSNTAGSGGSHRISAGGLVQLYGGAEYGFESAPVTIQSTLGYHFDQTKTSNGNARFTRMPLELISFWNISDKIRLGMGMRKAFNSKVQGSRDFAEGSVKAKLGGIVQAEYLITKNMSVSVRYVDERYKSVQFEGGGASGNHGGIGFAYRF